MIKAGFVGFGEVNTPKEIIVKKCAAAHDLLHTQGIDTVSVYPVTDDYEERDIAHALDVLGSEDFDCLVLCVAGWIPTHAVIKITEHYRHIPMVLWGLCGWVEGDRLVTTADQAGTSALRGSMASLGYTFSYIYDIVGLPSRADRVAAYCRAASAAKRLRHARVGFGGYRDMNLYGTQADGTSLKRVVGPEIETFELLEIYQRSEHFSDAEKDEIVTLMKQGGEYRGRYMKPWSFVKPAAETGMRRAAGYFLAVDALIRERGYDGISLKDVDGMKRLLGFPPAPVFMLLSDLSGVCTVPENDCLGSITQLMVKYLTGQCAMYLEFYEYFTDRVLAGVPDYIPAETTEGTVTVMPAAFGELSEGILNVSKVKTGELTLCRLSSVGDRYVMHMVRGFGKTPRKWEEAGWTQPAPQLPGLEIMLDDAEDFAEKVMGQHYIISYGNNTAELRALCDMLGIKVI